MKLITEENRDVECKEHLNEATGQKEYYIEGIFMQSDVPNKNNRIYPFGVLQKEVQRYKTEYVNQNRAVGELGHPNGPTINLERVSHRITEMSTNGKNFFGKAKIMDTPMGNIVKNFVTEGVKIGVSSRGMGSVQNMKNGIQEVQSDFVLNTVDIVADPSAPQAFVRGIMEGKEWVWENGVFRESELEESKKKIEKIHRSVKRESVEHHYLELFKGFLGKIK